MKKSSVLLTLALIIVVAAGIRLYGLDRQSLWNDEMYEQAMARELFSEDTAFPIFGRNTPPLFVFFLYPIVKAFPNSDFAIRMVPFTFGLISVPLLFLLGKRLFNEKVGLIAAFLLAISPFQIWYSQEARMYILQWMFALISLLYFFRALEKPEIGNFIGFTVSTLAGLYSHQLAVFLMLVQGLYLLIFYRKYKAQYLRWACAFAGVVILYSPWIIHMATLTGTKAGVLKTVDYKAILYTIYTYCAGYSIGPSLIELHFNQSLSVIKPYVLVIGPLMITYSTLFMIGCWSLKRDRPGLTILLLLFLIPIAGAFMLNKVMPSVTYNVRYTATAFFAFLLFIAKGVEWLAGLKSNMTGKILAFIAIAAITGFSTYSYANYQFDKKYHKEDTRGAAAYVKENATEDDVALCIYHYKIFNRYSKRNPRCLTMPAQARNNKPLIDRLMREAVKGRKRFWLVLIRDWPSHLGNVGDDVKEWLEANYKEIKHLHKGGDEIANIRIYCYDLDTIVRKKAAWDRGHYSFLQVR